jgi:phosphate/sulfate permease
MQAIFDAGLGTGRLVLLAACILIAFGFEFVNGFHDTANAVATVIYTNSLRPRVAVVLSGVCNFVGVFAGGIAVAVGIVKLLPVELLVSSGPGAGLAMVLALLLAAILWNLGTWYLGIPASSSHTLIGAILGVGLANSLLPGHRFGDGVNWDKAKEIGLSLLVSPLFGFAIAALLLVLLRRYTKNRVLLEPPPRDKPPPLGTRLLLMLTCSGVSFAHGSNDGQKGVGIVMLILMGLVPSVYALDQGASSAGIQRTTAAAVALEATLRDHADAAAADEAKAATVQLEQVRAKLEGHGSVGEVPAAERFHVRQAILLADKSIDRIVEKGGLGLTAAEAKKLADDRKALRSLTEYAPTWVLVCIALSLGIGTMIGWKRIVVTVGEKIGKSHLTYGQGAAAELVAMGTIGLSAWLGLPVSTTHVLSSGIAGTMVAQGSGLQKSTVRSIALAWVLTLPATVVLSAVLFLGFRAVLPNPVERGPEPPVPPALTAPTPEPMAASTGPMHRHFLTPLE